MTYDFDRPIERRKSGSIKWTKYSGDVLPMWVADMDFASPEPVIQALRERVEHGVFGYEWPSTELTEVVVERMQRVYHWTIKAEDVIFLPGLVSGINIVCRAIGSPGDAVLLQPPVYPPFLTAPANHGLTTAQAPLTMVTNGHAIRYEIDYDAFEAAITPRTRLFLLCHPHNPTGTDYSPEQLARMGEICLRHGLTICSDEIHCDLMLGGARHTPMACVSPEIAANCITLMAPSKTFNLAGLGCSFAIVQNAALREQVKKAEAGIVPHVNALGLTAALAAYRHGDDWLDALRQYLTVNRDTLVDYVAENLPGVRTTEPQATYLAWLDFRESGIQGNPFEWCLEKAKIAMNDGAAFGSGGEGFVRFNFGCPRSQVIQALDQIKNALIPV